MGYEMRERNDLKLHIMMSWTKVFQKRIISFFGTFFVESEEIK